MRSNVSWICVLIAALAGCAGPEPVESDARGYLPALTAYLPGVWEVTNQPRHVPFFCASTSADDAPLNPPGLSPIRGVAPESLQLIVFPGQLEERFEEWQSPHGVLRGYLLARIVARGVTREYVRQYTLDAYDEGKVELDIWNANYTLLVAPEQTEMKLVHSGILPEEPDLELRRIDDLPGWDRTFMSSLNGQPLRVPLDGLPRGVQTAN